MTEKPRKRIMDNLKIDYGDIFGFFIVLPMSLCFSFTMMFAPLWLLSEHYAYIISKDNILQFYVVSFLNIVWIILFQKITNAAILMYNIEYKRRQDDSISLVKRYFLATVTFGVFSNRLFVNVLYMIVLIIGHLQDLEIVTITNNYLSQIIKVNKYAIVILNSMDKVISELNKSVSFWPYMIKRWLELFYMKRIRFADYNTRQRIVYLLQKRQYEKIFHEFSYVVDEMIDYSGYSEYAKKIELINDDLFWRYYKAIGEDALILSLENENCIEEISTYFYEKLDAENADHLINSLVEHDLRDEAIFDKANQMLSSKGVYLKHYFDQINNKILLSIRHKSS